MAAKPTTPTLTPTQKALLAHIQAYVKSGAKSAFVGAADLADAQALERAGLISLARKGTGGSAKPKK